MATPTTSTANVLREARKLLSPLGQFQTPFRRTVAVDRVVVS